MARLTVYTPTQPNDREIFISLRKLDREDDVALMLVDAKGESIAGGSLMVITPDGFYPLHGVSSKAGVATDPNKNRQMKELTECPL